MEFEATFIPAAAPSERRSCTKAKFQQSEKRPACKRLTSASRSAALLTAASASSALATMQSVTQHDLMAQMV